MYNILLSPGPPLKTLPFARLPSQPCIIYCCLLVPPSRPLSASIYMRTSPVLHSNPWPFVRLRAYFAGPTLKPVAPRSFTGVLYRSSTQLLRPPPPPFLARLRVEQLACPHIRGRQAHFVRLPPHIRGRQAHFVRLPPHIRGRQAPFVRLPPHIRGRQAPFVRLPPHIRGRQAHFVRLPPHIRGRQAPFVRLPPHIRGRQAPFVRLPPHIRGRQAPFVRLPPHIRGRQAHFVRLPPHIRGRQVPFVRLHAYDGRFSARTAALCSLTAAHPRQTSALCSLTAAHPRQTSALLFAYMRTTAGSPLELRPFVCLPPHIRGRQAPFVRLHAYDGRFSARTAALCSLTCSLLSRAPCGEGV
jgi:hypothetical protein